MYCLVEVEPVKTGFYQSWSGQAKSQTPPGLHHKPLLHKFVSLFFCGEYWILCVKYDRFVVFYFSSRCMLLHRRCLLCESFVFSPRLCRPLQLERGSLCVQPPHRDLSTVARCGDDPQSRALTHSHDVRPVDAAGLPRHVCSHI